MATINIDVCAGLEASGHTVHYSKPEPMPVQVKDIRRVGLYVGAYHTPSLQQAQTTIFLDNDGSSPLNVIALHVAQSPMIVRQRMMAAREGYQAAKATAEATVAIAKAKAPASLAPAPTLKPRVAAAKTTAGTGGF